MELRGGWWFRGPEARLAQLPQKQRGLSRLQGRHFGRLRLEDQPAVLMIDPDVVAVLHLATQHLPGDDVFDFLLDEPPQRARAEVRVVPFARQVLLGRVSDLEPDALTRQPGRQVSR